MTFRPLHILEVLDRHAVRSILIGGLAGNARGSTLVTGDVDICYDRSDKNLEALAAALVELNATLRGAPDGLPFVPDAKTLKAGDAFTFKTDAGALDCLGSPAGTKGYADLASRADAIQIDKLVVFVASLDDLIRMKQAAGRQRDLDAIHTLKALRDELEGR